MTPCVTLLTARPSPEELVAGRLWMSMKPGATTRPRASMRRRAGAPAAAERCDTGDAVAADRDVAGNQALPVPSTILPPSRTTSKGASCANAAHARRARTERRMGMRVYHMAGPAIKKWVRSADMVLLR